LGARVIPCRSGADSSMGAAGKSWPDATTESKVAAKPVRLAWRILFLNVLVLFRALISAKAPHATAPHYDANSEEK
jgi:hypothetical protein